MGDRRARLAAACGAFSVIVLTWVLVSHAWPLWTGEPLYLRVRPVDPRDMFRGDYVVLGYDLNQIDPLGGAARSGREGPDAEPSGEEPAAFPQALAVEPSEDLERAIEEGRAVGSEWLRAQLQDRPLCVQLEERPSPAPGVPSLHVAVHASLSPEPGRTNLCGRIRWSRWRIPDPGAPVLDVDYGIDALFVPEGSGAVLERAIREGRPVFAEILVTGSGRARLRDVIVDGRGFLGGDD